MSPELVVSGPVIVKKDEDEEDDFDITRYHQEMMKPVKRKRYGKKLTIVDKHGMTMLIPLDISIHRRLRDKKALTAEEIDQIRTKLGNDESSNTTNI